MKRVVKIAAIATLVAVVAIAAVGAVVLAQEGSEESSGWNLRDKMHEAIASILGITVEKYEEAIETAKDRVLKEAVDDEWLTQKQADRVRERLDEIPERFRWSIPIPRVRVYPGMRGESLISIAAEKLDMSLSDLMDELQDGKSIADVAKDKGVETQTIVDAYVAQVKEKLDQQVEDENITQKQADAMLKDVAEQAAEQLEAACGGCWPGGFMMWRGRGHGFGFFGWGGF
jgi:gas vesicle protein